jgi:hypothetical protein
MKPELIRKLAAKGFTAEQIADILECLPEEMVLSAGAIRTRRWREGKRHQASPSVTDRHQASQTSQSVTKEEGVSPSPSPSPSPLITPLPLPLPLPLPQEETTRFARGRASRVARTRTSYPEGFQPSREYAKERGFQEKQIDLLIEAFRNHHTAKGNLMADWNAAWRTWCGNELKYGGTIGQQRPYPAPRQTHADAILAGVANYAKKRGLFKSAEGSDHGEVRGSDGSATRSDANSRSTPGDRGPHPILDLIAEPNTPKR